MAKTPEPDPQRYDYVKGDGTQCKRTQGWSTDHNVGLRKTYGANSPTRRKAAAHRTIASIATEANPYEVLLKTMRLSIRTARPAQHTLAGGMCNRTTAAASAAIAVAARRTPRDS